MKRLKAILTREQIRKKMADVTRLAEQAAANKAERLKRKELEDNTAENEMFFTGVCGYCGKPVGPRARWCRNNTCRRRALRARKEKQP